MSDDIVARLLRFRPVYDWPEETSTVVEKPLNQVAVDEITRLRAELAAVTAERDRMREALKPFAAQLDHPGNTYEHNGVRMALVNQDILDRLCRRARAALEGVTEPPR